LLITVRLGRRSGVDPDQMWNLGIIAVLAGILGSKILLIINDWDYYSAHLREIFTPTTLQAGGVFSGGLLLSTCFSMESRVISSNSCAPTRSGDRCSAG